tara:strand:- start:356 stop:799 length:444 start_codon:yes stop_codon:yes gene_type:complete
MAVSKGFSASNSGAAEVAIGQTYAIGKIVTVNGAGTTDAGAQALPGACHMSHIEFQCDDASGSPTTLTFYLCHDVLGNFPASAASTFTLVRGLTDATLSGGAVALDVSYFTTDVSVSGTIYAMCKTDAGTIDIDLVRLYWTRPRSGQ